MIKQSCFVFVCCWMFIGFMFGKVLFYLLESNFEKLNWIEQHHLLTINSVALLFGLCGLVIWWVNKKSYDH
jgi:hypothetical protein